MTKLLEKAFDAVRKLPADQQDELAELLLAASAATPYALTAKERRAIGEGLKEAELGRFAADAEVTALFAKHRQA